jgi:adenine-specific DNA-methyltransferase
MNRCNMDGTSLTPEQEKINALQKVLPEAFSEGKIDWEKLKATLGENVNFSNERYVLNWAGKSDAFKVLQMPTTKTLIPAKDESVNFETTENIFIEGENLEVLKVLQKSYFGKVKMIYIDPPYNTGNDSFIYPDKFSESKADYEKRVGDIDEEGYMTKDGMFKKNSKENGQYHSNWLNMMMPRLYLAKNLLRQDGVIFVSIDDNEVHNLRLLMNEIFGEENFVGQISVVNNPRGRDYGGIAQMHEYLIVFTKSTESVLNDLSNPNKEFPFNDEFGGFELRELRNRNIAFNKENRPNLYYPFYINTNNELDNGLLEISLTKIEGFIELYPKESQGYKTVWRWGKEKSKENLNKEIAAKQMNDGGFMIVEKYRKSSRMARSVWADKEDNSEKGTLLVKNLFDGKKYFDFPKSMEMVTKIIEIGSNPNDLILDFFAGSGTTAHAVMDLNKQDGGNRKYICVQLPERTDEKSEAYKSGYKTIADISKERIRRAGKKLVEIKKTLKKIESSNTLGLDLGEESIGYAIIEKGEYKTIDNSDNVQKLDIGFKVLKLEDSNFKQWQQIQDKDVKTLSEQLKLFVDPVSESATIENMVYELLLKSGKDLNSTIENKEGYFLVNGNEMALILEKVSQEIITQVISKYPKKVIALDKLFKGNDQLKTNTVLQMRDAGIEFKTI